MLLVYLTEFIVDFVEGVMAGCVLCDQCYSALSCLFSLKCSAATCAGLPYSCADLCGQQVLTNENSILISVF